MTLTAVLQTIFEFVLIICVAYAFFNEDKLVSFERRIIARFRRRHFKVRLTRVEPVTPIHPADSKQRIRN